MNIDNRNTVSVIAGTIVAGLFALQAVTAVAQQRGGQAPAG
jgi:hypothetical protein